MAGSENQISLKFEIYIQQKGNQKDPLHLMMQDVIKILGKKNASLKIYNVDGDDAEVAKKMGIEEVPALLFEKVRISGQLNEYFILACVAQLLTSDGNDQSGSDIELNATEGTLKMKAASAFLAHQTQIRDETKTFLMLIRQSTDDYSVKYVKDLANSGATVYLLTNFREGANREKIAEIGSHENILLGHIHRNNIHKTLAITVRKGRPFFGAFLRGKFVNEKWSGKWSPLLHDTVSELKNFYIPLFMTSSPVHLDGSIPEPAETNRLVAKVKDNVELIKSLFF
ncbi:MAG: thioredoxin family protein [Candidatus Heimdallarchaeota archaeon]|nr:thioredoxin family protein [Candidatus Heimdallarchaeota archaeon]